MFVQKSSMISVPGLIDFPRQWGREVKSIFQLTCSGSWFIYRHEEFQKAEENIAHAASNPSPSLLWLLKKFSESHWTAQNIQQLAADHHCRPPVALTGLPVKYLPHHGTLCWPGNNGITNGGCKLKVTLRPFGAEMRPQSEALSLQEEEPKERVRLMTRGRIAGKKFHPCLTGIHWWKNWSAPCKEVEDSQSQVRLLAGLHWLVCNQRLGLCFRIEDLRNSRWSALWSDYRCGERSCHQRSDPISLNLNKRLARGFTPLQMTRAKRPTERICWSCLYVEDVAVMAHGRNIEEVRRMVQSFVGAYRMRLVKDASKWILQTTAWARIFNREPIFQVTVGTTPL